MKVTVDADACQGQQMCAIAAPEVFGSDEWGHAVVLVTGEIPAGLRDKVLRAQANCPENAIRITGE